jgi:hypothetical protein
VWWTPEGARVLTGHEWALFREGLDYCRTWVEETLDHEDDWEFGVQAFDVLQPNQRIAVLANVGIALTDKTVPYPDLTTHDEAAIAAKFRTVLDQIGLEIDCAPFDPKRFEAIDKPEGHRRHFYGKLHDMHQDFDRCVDDVETSTQTDVGDTLRSEWNEWFDARTF